jgi:methylenetetrahydrofolate reductase (NADPH)
MTRSYCRPWFHPEHVRAWDRHLAEHGTSLPVHVGIAGRTPLPKLVRFAMHCGVGASMHSLMKNMSAIANLARLATSPDEMLTGLVRCRATCAGSRLVQPHFYSFGGAVATARWLRAVVDGAFELQPDGGKFMMDA